MRNLMIIAVLAAGCSRPMSFVEYTEPAGEFSVKVPEGWDKSERGPFSRKPIGEVWWVGKVVADHEGWPIGAMLFVRKLDRRPEKTNVRYLESMLKPTDALFDGTQPPDIKVQKDHFLGFPMRRIERDYEESTGGGIHGPVKVYPARTRATAIQTPDSYYLIEYRATRDLFERYLPAYERMAASFKLLK